jgi:CheY-like chemotaxis protein
MTRLSDATLARSKPKILVAEDNEDVRQMLRTLLEFKGYEVLEARNGNQAVDVALTAQPELILLDLQLPLMDGLEVTRELRAQANEIKVPIVILSGHEPATHRQAALAAGCNDYLLKPIDLAQLDRMLATYLPEVKIRLGAAGS